jgi:nucleoside 2-deoxyribosyltransferase
MKIYFAGAIRGGRDDVKLYEEIIMYLRSKGQVLTEHVGSQNLDGMGEKEKIDSSIYKRDMEWLQSADVIIAEVTTPSLGVGYELGIAEKLKKPTLCLYRVSEGKCLSAMISGNKMFDCCEYNKITEVKLHINKFLNKLF